MVHGTAVTYVVGVTGGIGSGKTAATNRLEQHGVTIVDADIVARQVVEPGSEALNKIQSQFGDQFILDDGNLDRAKMRELVFSQPAMKDKLNTIMQPAIRAELMRQLSQAHSDYVVLSAPLLFENSLHKVCNRVLVIDVPEEIQLQRASQRDEVSKANIKAIIAAQISRVERQALADDLLLNDGSIEELNIQIDQLHKKYLTLASG